MFAWKKRRSLRWYRMDHQRQRHGSVNRLQGWHELLARGKVPSKRSTQKKCKADAKACESDLTSTYSCFEPARFLTFSTLEEADEHVDTGHHVMLPENECVYDTIWRRWAAKVISVKGKSQKIGESQYHSYAAVQEEASHGWALRRQKTDVRISPPVKEYPTRVFNEGTKRGQPKANPAGDARVSGSTDHQRVFFSTGGFAEGPRNKRRRHKQWRCGDRERRIPSGRNTGDPETNWSPTSPRMWPN